MFPYQGGDKVPRKGGPGITQSDLLVVNKTDLAEAVGADLKVYHYLKHFHLHERDIYDNLNCLSPAPPPPPFTG